MRYMHLMLLIVQNISLSSLLILPASLSGYYNPDNLTCVSVFAFQEYLIAFSFVVIVLCFVLGVVALERPLIKHKTNHTGMVYSRSSNRNNNNNLRMHPNIITNVQFNIM